MENEYTAVIPVRAGSRRLKNKNILPFGDSNLLIHKIRQLKLVPEIDQIVVSSDSPEMLEMAKAEGASVHKRTFPYADDKTKSFNEVVELIASEIYGMHMLWTPCVCPIMGPKEYIKAIDSYKSKVLGDSQYDSLVSVKLTKEYLWDEQKPLNYTMEHHVISQNLPNWYTVTNGLYFAPRSLMLERKYFLGISPYLYEVDKLAAIDIDDEYDLEMARAVYTHLGTERERERES